MIRVIVKCDCCKLFLSYAHINTILGFGSNLVTHEKSPADELIPGKFNRLIYSFLPL